MNVTIDQVQGHKPVTILRPHGDLDASSYESLIAKAHEVYQAGARHMIVDLSDVAYMSSSGVVALHSIAVLLRGDQPADRESGWEAIHAVQRDLELGIQPHVKLLNPQAQVDRVLQKSGLKQFFEIHTDQNAAVASFSS